MESVQHLLLLVHRPIFLIGIRFCSCITGENNRLRHLLKNGKYAIHDDETCPNNGQEAAKHKSCRRPRREELASPRPP